MDHCIWLHIGTYLVRQHICPQITERQLELLQVVVDGDFDGDERVRWDRVVTTRCSHVADDGCGRLRRVGMEVRLSGTDDGWSWELGYASPAR